jgi:Skp family chaperone for outer membrane proteins
MSKPSWPRARSWSIPNFDQDVVRNLKAFKEADLAIAQERAAALQKIQAEIERTGRQPSPAEAQALKQSLEARLQAMQEQKMGPLVKAVTDSVAEVAKSENLSLVLDTQHVMHGGRNLTEQVVDNFLKKVDGAGATAQNPADGETPAAPATPGNGG